MSDDQLDELDNTVCMLPGQVHQLVSEVRRLRLLVAALSRAPSAEVSLRCECDHEIHGANGCSRSAWAAVTRPNGRRLKVCDHCDFPTDTNSVPLEEGLR